MTTSTYQYLTTANLEAFSGLDYSGVNAKYTDILIEAQITLAEEIINSITGTTFTGAVTDGVRGACKLLASRLMNNLIIVDGYGNDGESIMVNIIDDLVIKLISMNESSGISILPMNGLDPNYSNNLVI